MVVWEGRAWGQLRAAGATTWGSLVPGVHIYEHMSSPCPSVLLHSAVELKEGESTAEIGLFSIRARTGCSADWRSLGCIFCHPHNEKMSFLLN